MDGRALDNNTAKNLLPISRFTVRYHAVLRMCNQFVAGEVRAVCETAYYALRITVDSLHSPLSSKLLCQECFYTLRRNGKFFGIEISSCLNPIPRR